jgi:ribosomal protein L19E
MTKTETVLAFVTKKPGCSAADVMAATKIDNANTNGFLKSLVKQGRITKIKDKDTGRVTFKANAEAPKTAKPAMGKAAGKKAANAKKPVAKARKAKKSPTPVAP